MPCNLETNKVYETKCFEQETQSLSWILSEVSNILTNILNCSLQEATLPTYLNWNKEFTVIFLQNSVVNNESIHFSENDIL